MTLKGKKKALNNDPEAQIARIAAAFGGSPPTKPLPRRYAGAGWQEGNIWHIAKLTHKKLYHLMSKAKPQAITLFRDALSVCGYLAQMYHRKVSLPDLQAATAGSVPAPTLAEAQRAIICWIQDWKQAQQSTVPTWQYCIVTPEGIKSGTTQGKPKPVEGYPWPGPRIVVLGDFACKDLLRRAFQLDIQGGELRGAFGKVVTVPRIIRPTAANNSSLRKRQNTDVVGAGGDGK